MINRNQFLFQQWEWLSLGYEQQMNSMVFPKRLARPWIHCVLNQYWTQRNSRMFDWQRGSWCLCAVEVLNVCLSLHTCIGVCVCVCVCMCACVPAALPTVSVGFCGITRQQVPAKWSGRYLGDNLSSSPMVGARASSDVDGITATLGLMRYSLAP